MSTAPAQPAGIRILEGDAQVRFPNARLPIEPSVEVVDADGMRVGDADLRVEWTIGGGNGTVQPAATFTAGGGIASTVWVLGGAVGPQTITATAEGFPPVEFTAQAIPIGPIAFVSSRDVPTNPTTLNSDIATDLFLMEPDGSDVLRLTDLAILANWVKQPLWGLNGAEIGFVRDLLVNPTNPVTQALTADGVHFLHLLNHIERRAPPSTNSGFLLAMTEPALSPSGADIATVNGQIWLLTSNGTNVRSATADPNGGPSWSPDGTNLAFSCATGVCTQTAQQDQTRLAITSKSNDHAPDWSPDGSKIAFARTGLPAGIWMVDPAGTAEQQIALGNYTSPSWSPDGQQLVAVLTHTSGLRDIVHIDVASGQVTNLTDGVGDNWDPAWRR